MSTTLARNTAALTIASIGQKVLAFVYFLFLARFLGVEAIGAYTLALSTTTLFSVLTDVGLQPLLIREVAKGGDGWKDLFQQTLGLKLFFTAIAAFCVVVFSFLLSYDRMVIGLVSLAVLVMAVDAISLTMYGALRGLQKLSFESYGMFIGQCITAVVGVVAIWQGAPIGVFIIALLCGSLWNALNSFFALAKHAPHTIFRVSFDYRKAWQYLHPAFPFALASIFSKIYASIDSIFLEQFHGTLSVGVYAIAYKMTFAFQFLPMAFVAALYPAMSEVVSKDIPTLSRLFERGMLYLALLVAPIIGGIWAISTILIEHTAGSEFLESAPMLSVLIFSLGFLFLDYPIGSLLNAMGKQSMKTWVFGAALLIQIVGDLLLIPRFGGMGAALTSLGSYAVLFFVGAIIVSRLIPIRWGSLLSKGVRIFLCAAGMALVVRMLSASVSLIWLILIGGGLYPLGLLLLRVFRPQTLLEEIRPLLFSPKTPLV